MNSITSVELNYLVFRYLQESGNVIAPLNLLFLLVYFSVLFSPKLISILGFVQEAVPRSIIVAISEQDLTFPIVWSKLDLLCRFEFLFLFLII